MELPTSIFDLVTDFWRTSIQKGRAMNAREDFIEYEAVLSYCRNKTMSGYEQAVHYGRLSGYFTSDNKLTPMGRKIARLLEDGLAA